MEPSKNKAHAIIFWLAILLLIGWVVVPVLCDLFGLTLTNKRLSEFYHNTRHIVVPSAIMLTLFRTLKKETRSHIELRTIFFTVMAALLSILIFMLSILQVCADL